MIEPESLDLKSHEVMQSYRTARADRLISAEKAAWNERKDLIMNLKLDGF